MRRLGLLLSAALAAALPATAARAAEFTIAAGDVAGLRQAVTDANATPDADTIVLAAGGVYAFTDADLGEGNTALPGISRPLTIQGNGATLERATGAATEFRLLRVGPPAGDLTLDGVTLRGGRLSGGAAGAGILSVGVGLTIVGSTLTDHRCDDAAVNGPGGAIYTNAPLTLRDSAITDSRANTGGGIAALFGSPITLERAQVTGNVATAVAGGGGIGGGIAAAGVTATVTESTIADNEAVGTATAGARGGGVAEDAGGVWAITRSTISGNRATASVDSTGDFVGGGIYAGNFSTFSVTNTTITGNLAFAVSSGRRDGGGIAIDGTAGTWALANVTLAGNNPVMALPPARSPRAGSMLRGGGLFVGGGQVAARNTLLADNAADAGSDCYTADTAALVSGGYVLLETTPSCNLTAGTGDVTGEDPLLGPLADNGGPTHTRALGDGSPAIDAGSPDTPGSGGAACEATDQRCVVRPGGARCDIGAVEQDGTSGACQGGTTTTTTAPTTTTTLPGCGTEATFASLTCRLDALVERTQTASDLGKLRRSLLEAVQAARAKTADAEALVAQGKTKPARRKLKVAVRKVTGFLHRLNSRSGRRLPDATRQPFLDEATPIQTALKALLAAT